MKIFIDFNTSDCAPLYEELCGGKEDFIYLKHLAWDSDFFGVDSYLLDVSKSRFLPGKDAKAMIEERFQNCFLSVKLDTRVDYAMTYFLQECGFYYVDTEVELKLAQKKESQPLAVNLRIEELKVNEGLPYQKLGSAFNLTRFHTDLNIPNEKADELWIRYIQNYKLSVERRLFAAFYGEEVCGVILSNIHNGRAVLFFVSVLDGFRGKNIGSSMIRYSTEMLGGFDIYTETQVKNIKALNFYIKNGFSEIAKTLTVLHRWK